MNKKKMKLLSVFLLATATIGCTVNAQSFEKQRSYDDRFTDVPESEWYASEVKNAYELNLMNGNGDSTFSPNGDVTIAEAVTLASRCFAIYNGETINTETDGEWYTPYFDYAVKNGIMEEDTFDNPDRPAKRHELASLFRKALPDSYYNEINNVERIIDVSENAPYEEDLLTLYRAGVVMGSDSYGSFKPESNITRAEAAAVIGRMALPETRISKELLKYSHYDAYLLDRTTSYNGYNSSMKSAWLLDGRGSAPKTSVSDTNSVLVDIYDDAGTAYIREFNKFSTGRIVLDTSVSVNGEGVILEYRNEKDTPVYHLESTKDAWMLLDKDGQFTKIFDIKDEKEFAFRIVIDLDNELCTTYINETDCGTYPLCVSGDEVNILNFRFATTDEGTPSVTPGSTFSTVNYAVYEGFDRNPFYFEMSDGAELNKENSSLILNNGASVSDIFTPVGVKSAAEFSMILPQNESVRYTLYSAGNVVAEFTTDLDNFYLNGEKVYEYYYGNLWYRLRFELDSDTQTILFKVNGNEAATIPFATAVTSIDGFKMENLSETPIEVDTFKVFRLVEHEDYVPAPVRPKGEEKYTVGMNFCSLWQEGTHWGWGIISGFRDREPVLGYYDEGTPETADWEIKYLVEHGVDFEALCWFPDKSDAPIKDPPYSAQLYDGIKNAKYSNEIKYCLIWEMSNGEVPASLGDWKKHYVPYMIEYFFKDPRYMRVNNKALMASFGSGALSGALGKDGAREALDYLEKELKKIGYDGLYYIGNGGTSQISDGFSKTGVDGAYSYNWGPASYSSELNKQNILTWFSNPYGIGTVPTVAVAFNETPWAGMRYKIMSKKDNLFINKWVRDTFMPMNIREPELKNLVWLSTWNEYGEGHYMMPVTDPEIGFRYLDVIREVYTDEGEDPSINIVPTPEQKERITHLYPQYRKLLTREYYDLYDVSDIKDDNIVYTINCGTDPDWTAWSVNAWRKDASGSYGTSHNTETAITVSPNFKGDFDARDITHIRVTMQSPVGSTIRFYYRGAETSNFQGYAWTSDTNEVTTYTIDTSSFQKFQGKLDYVRIDPTQFANTEFMVKSIEFISLNDDSVLSKQITIDDKVFDNTLSPYITKENTVMLPFDPNKTAIDSRLGVFYLWNLEKKELTLNTKTHSVVFTADSNIAIVNGEEKKLASPVELIDSIPAIPIEEFCKYAGYSFEITEDKQIVIVTPRKAQVDAEIAARVPGIWEFKTINDTEGWTSYTLSLNTANGILSGSSAGTEPNRHLTNNGPLNIDLSGYSGVEVKIKYKYTADKPSSMTIYFTTEEDPKWGEDKNLYVKHLSTDSGDDFVVYTFDFSKHEKWNGTLRGLRYDAFNTTSGKFEIDYIRLIPKE